MIGYSFSFLSFFFSNESLISVPWHLNSSGYFNKAKYYVTLFLEKACSNRRSCYSQKIVFVLKRIRLVHTNVLVITFHIDLKTKKPANTKDKLNTENLIIS